MLLNKANYLSNHAREMAKGILGIVILLVQMLKTTTRLRIPLSNIIKLLWEQEIYSYHVNRIVLTAQLRLTVLTNYKELYNLN